ncbi:MAG TPA: NAD-dependent epimerase/dehydratase family protein [Caulobacteraceae bacterium]|nr:NAD-dependent epimerase/dehydratase family protein [Caulobacteraceae bacterium]
MDRKLCVLVTGASGFVGRHLVTRLRSRFDDAIEIVPTDKEAGLDPEFGAVQALDVTDDRAAADVIASTQPTHVVHLSAMSAPSDADVDPRAAWMVNALGTLSVAEAILRRAPSACLVFASTGLVYGAAATPARPFTEDTPMAPISDYAVTKASADLLIGAMASRGLRSIRLRLFNHTGPGQSRRFVVPNFAAQIARIEAGVQAPRMQVGSLTALRDFVDVRDVVAAYVAAIVRSQQLPPSPIINIASGRGHTIGEILSRLIALSPAQIEIEAGGPSPLGQPDSGVGDASLAARLLGWKPEYGMQQTLISVLDYWRERTQAEVASIRPR